jgi:uncharacterized membrane protein YhaH (DUF805 family)
MPLPPFQTDPRTQKLPLQLANGMNANGWHYAQGDKTFGPVDLKESSLWRAAFFGRLNRARYWIGVAITFGMMHSALLLFLWLEPEGTYWNEGIGLWVLLWIVALLAVATKRLHDLNISGWWLLGFMIVYAALLIGVRPQEVSIGSAVLAVGMIWLGSTKGTKGSNRFGPDPISMGDAAQVQ